MWPSIADSFEINFQINPYHVMVRGIVLLNYLQFRTPYTKYVEQYLKTHNKTTNFHYAIDIFNILNTNFQSLKNEQREFASFTLNRSPGFESLFDQFTLNLEIYKQKYSAKKENYAGIKSRPLYRLDDDTWLVLNWTFLSNKLYEGLIFDFYNNSGISKTQELDTFLKFKKLIGEQITEKHLFQQLSEASWSKKYEVLMFDNNKGINGIPDAYYRIGNKVFLFEIKDAYFPSEAINSFSYDKIKAAIDTKLNSDSKGTGQLIKQLKKMKTQSFEDSKGYKKTANIEVYPIIVYTDIHFNMPGVNEYVNRSFQAMLDDSDMKGTFRKIWPLTMININYLVEIFDVLNEKSTSLDLQIEYFHNQIANRTKKHERLLQIEYHQPIYDIFENVTRGVIKKKTM